MAPYDFAPPIGRRAHATWLLFGGLFTGLVVAAGAVGSWVVLNGTGPTATRTERHDYPQRPTRIEIDVRYGDVRIIGGANQVSAERRLEYGERRPTVTETWRGDTLVIRARCELSALERMRNERCAVGYALRVPAAVEVDANVGFGAIRVDDIDGELRLSTASGDVEVRNARSRVRLRSGSGAITATGLRGAEVEARTGAGDVSLSFEVSPGLARAATGYGSVEVALPPGDKAPAAYHVRAEVANGQRYVDVPSDPASQHEVFATTEYGDVYVRYSNG